MKFNYRKIASVIASTVMLSSTVGFAAAANVYPAPFVVGGAADGAVVVGQNGPLDVYPAVDVMNDLNKRAPSTDSTATTTSTGGDAKVLNSGSDLLYLGQALSTNIGTITKDDLKTVLADGTFVDDEGTEYDYEQTIVVGTSNVNNMAFSTSSGDLDDPAMMIEIATDATTPVYKLTVSFDEAVNLTKTDSKGQPIKIFGKEYTIGTGTDADTLVLLGGSSETTVNVGEKVPVEVNGKSYELSLNGISDASTPVASLSLNGESKTFSEGQTKKVSGIDVYAKTVFRQGDNAGYVIVQLGSDKITLENSTNVMMGSTAEDIDGTLAVLTGGVGALTKLEVWAAAPEDDGNFILEGKSFKDPVFGSVSVDFVDVKNGPVFEKEKDTAAETVRKKIAIASGGDRELGLSITGQTASLPFVYQGSLQDERSKAIHVVEGESVAVNEYVVINSGSYQFLYKLTKLDLGTSTGDSSRVTFTDQLGSTDCDVTSTAINVTAGTSTTCNPSSQTLTITTVDSTHVTLTTSDYSNSSGTGKIAVYPYIEPITGKDVRWAYAKGVTFTAVNGTTIELPTGSVALDGTTTTQKVGNVSYTITTTAGPSNLYAVKPFNDGNASVLFVEEEDNSVSTANVFNAVLLSTTDDGSYSEAKSPQFTDKFDQASFDESDFTGYLTTWGSYILKDTGDSDQTLVSLTYSAKGEQMYGEVFISEVGAVLTPGSGGSGGQIQMFRDNEVSSFSNKNILVVGGSCVNTVALKILDSAATSPLCGAEFTAKTTVGPGQYLIKTVKSPYNEAKLAVLVAGYESADTTNAVGKLKEGAKTESGETIVGPQLSA